MIRLRVCAVGLLIAAPATIFAQEMAGRWTLAIGEDPSSYEVVASLQQDAANTIKDEYATKDVTPVLSLRCAPGDPAVTARIDWQRFISSFNTEVGFKVDGGKTLWIKWGVDRSNKITLSKSADDSKALLAHLADGKSLQVEVTPYSESPVTVEFDLAGLAQGLEQLHKECS
jgi:type VI secretion system protein VasI